MFKRMHIINEPDSHAKLQIQKLLFAKTMQVDAVVRLAHYIYIYVINIYIHLSNK